MVMRVDSRDEVEKLFDLTVKGSGDFIWPCSTAGPASQAHRHPMENTLRFIRVPTLTGYPQSCSFHFGDYQLKSLSLEVCESRSKLLLLPAEGSIRQQ